MNMNGSIHSSLFYYGIRLGYLLQPSLFSVFTFLGQLFLPLRRFSSFSPTPQPHRIFPSFILHSNRRLPSLPPPGSATTTRFHTASHRLHNARVPATCSTPAIEALRRSPARCRTTAAARPPAAVAHCLSAAQPAHRRSSPISLL